MQSWLKVGNPPIELDFGTRVSTWIKSQPYERAIKSSTEVKLRTHSWTHSSWHGKQAQASPGSPAFGKKQWSTQVQQKYGRHAQQSSPGFGGHNRQAYSPGFGGHNQQDYSPGFGGLTQRASYQEPSYDIDDLDNGGTPGFKQQKSPSFKYEFERRAHARRSTQSRRHGEAKGARAVPQRASRLFRRR